MNQLAKSGIFTLPDIVTLTGLSEAVVKDWRHRRLFRSSVRDGGRGKQSLYSFADLFAVHLAASLRHAGLSLSVCRKAVELLYESAMDSEKPYLCISAESVTLASSAEINRLLARGTAIGHVNIIESAASLREGIDEQLAEREQAEIASN